jgi:hypothetical protein
MPILTPDLWTDADPWTDARVARLADAGRGVLLEAAVPLRLRDAVKERRLLPEQGRRIVRRLIGDARSLVRAATDALAAGGLRLGTWFGAMRDALVPGHFAAGFAVLNNPDPPPADVAAIVAESRRQVGYLERFRGQLATAQQLLSGAAARAELYTFALWSVGQGVGRDRAMRDGYHEEISILGAADHCQQCIDEALMDWQPIGSLTPVGFRVCRSRCACFMTYR